MSDVPPPPNQNKPKSWRRPWIYRIRNLYQKWYEGCFKIETSYAYWSVCFKYGTTVVSATIVNYYIQNISKVNRFQRVTSTISGTLYTRKSTVYNYSIYFMSKLSFEWKCYIDIFEYYLLLNISYFKNWLSTKNNHCVGKYSNWLK